MAAVQGAGDGATQDEGRKSRPGQPLSEPCHLGACADSLKNVKQSISIMVLLEDCYRGSGGWIGGKEISVDRETTKKALVKI